MIMFYIERYFKIFTIVICLLKCFKGFTTKTSVLNDFYRNMNSLD